VQLQLRTFFFSNNARNDDRNYISFEVNYNSVAHKLRILEIEAIVDPKNKIFNNSMDDRIKIERRSRC
jgi:hypothetical protein